MMINIIILLVILSKVYGFHPINLRRSTSTNYAIYSQIEGNYDGKTKITPSIAPTTSTSTSNKNSWNRKKYYNNKKHNKPRNRPIRRYDSGALHRQVDNIIEYKENYDNNKDKTQDKEGRKEERIRIRRPTITDVNHALTAAGRIGRTNDAIMIFDNLEPWGLVPDIMTYNNMIWTLGNSGNLELVKKYHKQLLTKRPKLHPNIYTYGALMHGCAKTKNHQLAIIYLERMQEEGIKPNNVVFTSVLEACAENGGYKEALSVLDTMKKLDVRPDITTYNAAIKACCLGGVMDEAEELAEQLRECGQMDLFTYHTLMMGNTKLKLHRRVLSLYDEAVLSAAKLDGGVYSLAMLAALNSGLYPYVPRIADKARGDGVKLTEASYTILMQAYGEAGGGDQAVTCLDTMIGEGLKPNVISYAAAMSACKSKPRVVQDLLERMCKEGIVPNTVVLTTAINAFARGGTDEFTQKAFQLLTEMETVGPEPNIFTYNTVTRAFAEAGRLQEAMSVLLSIRDRGLTPDRFTFTTLLIACGRQQRLLSNGNEIANQDADAKGEEDSVEAAAPVRNILQLMRDAQVVPDEIVYGAAIDAYRRLGNPTEAVACLQQMIEVGLAPTAAHYNLVLRSLKEAGKAEMMFRMITMLSNRDGAKINGNSIELTIEALLEKDMWREAIVMVSSMEEMSFQLSLELCVRLVEVLERNRQYKAVLALYKRMANNGFDFYEQEFLNGVFKRLVEVAAISAGADLASPTTVVSPLKGKIEVIPDPCTASDTVVATATKQKINGEENVNTVASTISETEQAAGVVTTTTAEQGCEVTNVVREVLVEEIVEKSKAAL